MCTLVAPVRISFFALFLAVGCDSAWHTLGCGARSAGGPLTKGPIQVSNCEQAQKYPDRVADDDVRFVECGNQAERGDAATLGNPVYVRSEERSAADALEYAPGQCSHGGGAISHHNVFYKPENVEAAIECSKRRCEANDALGCFDLGALHSPNEAGDAFFPAVRPNSQKAMAAYDAGCRLGHADSCMILASWHEEHRDSAESAALFERACMAEPPQVAGCLRRGEVLLAAGQVDEARPYLRRACRGVTREATPFSALRFGCGLLAELAARHGDWVSQREFLHLECAYGSRSLQACADLGILLVEHGEQRRAMPYLKRACAGLVDSKTRFAKACGTLAQLTDS